jgi:hypothetical protein
VVDCLGLGGINLEEHHALAPLNNVINGGKEYVVADQNMISRNIQNVE